MLRLVGFTQMARRPPNSGMVLASSTSRNGLPERSSPSMRTSENGSSGLSTEARTIVRARSLHQAGIGAVDQHDRPRGVRAGDKGIDIGGFESGHRSRTRLSRRRKSSPREEIRRQPLLDLLGRSPWRRDSRHRAARAAGEALLLSGNIVGDAREGAAAEHDLLGREIGQRDRWHRCRNSPRPGARW